MKYIKFFFIFYVLNFFIIEVSAIPVLKVYTNRSFAKGIGQSAKIEFEKTCQCKVEYIHGRSPFNILSTLNTLKQKPDLLVEVAYETLQTLSTAEKNSLFLPPSIDTKTFKLPYPWEDKFFTPLSYNVLSFIYNNKLIKTPPKNFEDLQKGNNKIILIDPRTSSPGLGLLLWIKQVYQDKSHKFWQTLKPNILTITKSWNEATALFLQGEAPLVLSYASSPAYHRLKEGKEYIKESFFNEGHYVQISVGAIIKDTPHKNLAEDFLKLLLSPKLQKKVVYEYWSYPVIDIGEELPKEFQIPRKLLPPLSDTLLYKEQKHWMKEWLNSLS